MFARILCVFGFHRPRLTRVGWLWRDGRYHAVAVCRRCGRAVFTGDEFEG